MVSTLLRAAELFELAPRPGMGLRELAEAIWQLPRDLVSDGYDAALAVLAANVPMTIHEYPTGTSCFTWTVPPKWTCADGRLETTDGEILFSYADHPLHVMSYSQPVDLELSREELFAHLRTNPRIKEAIPFGFHYYRPNWGLCCSEVQKQRLTEERYRVRIDSRLEPGALKVGEVVAPGRSEESIVLCAHLCHPHMFNDDLSGVLVGLEVMRALLKRTDRHYTYRLLILPETIGSAAWLSHNEALVPSIKAGLFLEMLGTHLPYSVQDSLNADTRWDNLVRTVCRERAADFWHAPFATLTLNDERMFSGPGIGVAMPSLARVERPDSPNRPYLEYHSDHDTPETASFENLHDAVELVLQLADALEDEQAVEPLFKGEIFCSGFPSIDYQSMFELIMSIPYQLDGQRTPLDIAQATGRSLAEVRNFLGVLRGEGLVGSGGHRPNPALRMGEGL